MTTSDLTKSIWLWLLQEGGKWTAAGVAEALGKSVDEVFEVISRLEVRGMVKKGKAENHRRLVYWVDGTCAIPQGMAVAEVQA